MIGTLGVLSRLVIAQVGTCVFADIDGMSCFKLVG